MGARLLIQKKNEKTTFGENRFIKRPRELSRELWIGSIKDMNQNAHAHTISNEDVKLTRAGNSRSYISAKVCLNRRKWRY